ncbi:hypothetical protein FLL45_04530 [Aliikangiella marina]|uniref:Uncharacterized protein n=1 Tax=Aliikangiella marina TaxID=1712262 RepID=A0A545TJ32_9GAMM|nr:hypothetical protein [Aliikangiella marina]TQV77218.1 hypothetical protein FLL45_04530 [Aliikangiella marina]
MPKSKKTKKDSSFSDYSPALQRLLGQMEPKVVESFSRKQLKSLDSATSDRGWRAHSFDFRPTVVIPFLPWSFYFVFLMGRNQRALSSNEVGAAAGMFVLMLSLFILILFGLLLAILYIIKSALGIDLFPDDSLGLWDALKSIFGD